ncbi:MAG TPA: radical SAM protein [Syntrophorhabdaceae bacterium]|nr:radical SAM protein [Syntrophorhabdaceae bacterium]
MSNTFKYIYGPVPSWRLGSSLGVDLLSQEGKICTFDCIYCQLGKTHIYTRERKVYIPEDLIKKEINLLPNDINIDYITFSGRGEPTLALNLGKTIKLVKNIRKEKIAVITNSTLLYDKDVQEELSYADFVIAKLDADSENIFLKINKPIRGITFDNVILGLKDFKKSFNGKLALQIMFIRENADHAREIAKLAMEINPDEVQINTPTRPCGAEALNIDTLLKIKEYFSGLHLISVYEGRKKDVKPISHEDTIKRRGKF